MRSGGRISESNPPIGVAVDALRLSALAKGWSPLVVPLILRGTFGSAIANFIGIGIGIKVVLDALSDWSDFDLDTDTDTDSHGRHSLV